MNVTKMPHIPNINSPCFLNESWYQYDVKMECKMSHTISIFSSYGGRHNKKKKQKQYALPLMEGNIVVSSEDLDSGTNCYMLKS